MFPSEPNIPGDITFGPGKEAEDGNTKEFPIQRMVLYSTQSQSLTGGYSLLSCGTDPMDAIQNLLNSLLQGPGGKISLVLNWDLQGFIRSQFAEAGRVDLGSIIVLNGSASCAQATTCSDYVSYLWPCHGRKILMCYQHALDHGIQKAEG